MIKEGELIFLYGDDRRNFLTKVSKNTLHTDKGFLKIENIIGRKFGEKIETNLGSPFYILRPYLYEMTMKVREKLRSYIQKI